MKKISTHARELSKLGASKGGKARANVLTPGERKEIARNAVISRWAKKKGLSTDEVGLHVSPPAEEPKRSPLTTVEMPISHFQGTLEMGGVSFLAHVLSSGNRVIVQREIVKALTGKDSGDLKARLGASAISKYIDLDEIAKKTISFKIPGTQYEAIGYDATLLVEICDAYLKARENEKLTPTQERLAKQAEIIVRACAKVGIIALIDEVTGYQEVRAKNALRLKLQAFIADEMQEWVKMFPDEFFLELARLESIRYSPRNRPLRWGRYVMMFVYDAIDKDVAKELKKRTPKPHKGENLHQWLTENFGKNKLTAHLNQVIGVMKTCRDMNDFRQKFRRIFSREPEQLSFFDLADSYPASAPQLS